MASQLKREVARGAQWTLGEKVATALVQFAVRVLILRLLLPDDLKVIAILLALSSFALVVVDSGFSQMLVRMKSPTERDLKSVFAFNLITSWVVYALLVVATPWLADFYRMPVLREVAWVFFLMIPCNALGVIQLTLLTRTFRFALISKLTFLAQLISGVVAIVMAYMGLGVWALVWQQVLMMALRSLFVWWYGGWRGEGSGSLESLRRMAPYSMSLLATDLITALYNKVPQLLLGRIYLDATLAYYDQAIKLKDLPVQSAMVSVQQVTFPALAKIADEEQKFAESFRQVVMMVAYLIFPVMVGMSAVSEGMFAVLLGEQWMPTVPLFEVVCLAGLFTPLAMMAYNVLKVKAQGGLIVRLEVMKKVAMTVLLVLSIPHSVEAVVWALVASAAFDMVVNFAAALPLAHLSVGRVVRTLLPIAAVSGVMWLAVQMVSRWIGDPSWWGLLLEIGTGAAVYLLLSLACRLEAWQELRSLARQQLKKGASN